MKREEKLITSFIQCLACVLTIVDMIDILIHVISHVCLVGWPFVLLVCPRWQKLTLDIALRVDFLFK